MSEETIYILKNFSDDNNSLLSESQYTDPKEFCSALKSNKKKKIKTSVKINDFESPLYLIRNKAVFANHEGKVLCFDYRSGKYFEKNKYSIEKDQNGNNQYVVKKDQNEYYRYLTDGTLVDYLKKEYLKNNFVYFVLDHKNKREKRVNLGPAENIDKARELTKSINVDKLKLGNEYILESLIFNNFGLYVDANKTASYFSRGSVANMFNGMELIIKNICIETGLNLDGQNSKNVNALISLFGENIKLMPEQFLKLNLTQEQIEILEEKDDELTLSKIKNMNLKNELGLNEDEENRLKNIIKYEAFKLGRLSLIPIIAEKFRYKVYILDDTLNIIKEIKKEHNIGYNQNERMRIKIEFENNDDNSKNNHSMHLSGVRFFNEKNEFDVDNKKNKITIGGENVPDGKYFFVKPLNQPMYFFKKEENDFSNHSNFPPDRNNPDRIVEFAGSMTLKNGKISNISNSSGHFKPPLESVKLALAYIASKTKDCKIENLIHHSCRVKDGYKVLSNIEVDKVTKGIKETSTFLTRTDIIKINAEAARTSISKNEIVHCM